MSDAATTRPDLRLLAESLDALSDGVVIFDPDWTIRYINRVGAHLMDRSPADLADSNLWIALPQLAGTIFHSFLLHAAGASERVTWQGFHAPTHRWLNASAVRREGRLHVQFSEITDRAAKDALLTGSRGEPERRRDDSPVVEHPGRNQARLRFLAEVSEAMISTLDTGESADTLAELVVGRLCDWAIVSVRGDDGIALDGGRAHADPERLADLDTYLAGRTRGGSDETPMITALLSGRPVQMTTIDAGLVEASLSTDEVREAWRRLDTVSCTIVPLRARGETFGALTMMNDSRRPPHTQMQLATAVEVARRASLALDNARLYGRQLKVAETLQRSLLTPPPETDGLEVAVRYVAAASHMHVGGDWYDGFEQPYGGTLLVIGDVVGHNVDAAAAMGQLRSIVRTIAYDRRESPAHILRRVDEVLTGVHIGTLATVLVALVEQSSEQAGTGLRTLRWSSAGHLPPLVLHPDGAVEVLATPPETLLGTELIIERTDHETVVGPGDTLLLYTDGIIEHGRIGIDAGIDRLMGVLSDVGDLTVDKLCDHVLTRIVSDHNDDDIALIAVRCGVEDGGR